MPQVRVSVNSAASTHRKPAGRVRYLESSPKLTCLLVQDAVATASSHNIAFARHAPTRSPHHHSTGVITSPRFCHCVFPGLGDEGGRKKGEDGRLAQQDHPPSALLRSGSGGLEGKTPRVQKHWGSARSITVTVDPAKRAALTKIVGISSACTGTTTHHTPAQGVGGSTNPQIESRSHIVRRERRIWYCIHGPRKGNRVHNGTCG